jgi:hypothetical protein
VLNDERLPGTENMNCFSVASVLIVRDYTHDAAIIAFRQDYFWAKVRIGHQQSKQIDSPLDPADLRC